MSAVPNKKRKYDNKSKYYQKSSKKFYLEAGICGFLATCNFREKECVRECYNILREYADELYGPDPNLKTSIEEEKGENDDDISDVLQNAINKTHSKFNKARFQVVDTGAANVVFIRTTLPQPTELGTHIVKDIASKRIQKSRFLLRLLPVEKVCHANVTDIENSAGLLFDKYFLNESHSFSIVFNKRYNNNIHRDEIIHSLAKLVQQKNANNRVDLKNPERAVVVEVIKGLCCISVVERYMYFKKYNLIELASAKPINESSNKNVDVEEKNKDAQTNNNQSLETEVKVDTKLETVENEGFEKT